MPNSLAERLSAKLEDSDSETRLAAAHTVAELCGHPNAVISELAATLIRLATCDPEEEIRAAAVTALSCAGGDGAGRDTIQAHTEELIKLLDDSSETVRRAAVHALGVNDLSAVAAAALVDHLPDLCLRSTIAGSLASMDDTSFASQAAAISVHLSHLDADLRLTALELLGQRNVSHLPSELLPRMLSTLDDEDPPVRAAAVALVGGLSQDAMDAVACAELLIKRFDDPDASVRSESLKAYANLEAPGAVTEGHLDCLVASCRDPEGAVRKQAVLTIGQVCDPAGLAKRSAAVDHLIACMNEDAASYVRAAAVEVLSKVDRAALAPQQAELIEKHLMGKCYARKAYEGKSGGGCA
jgi:HEAT repeat protein